MKIIHTSDWHLGHRLYEQSQQEEQLKFLIWLKEYINQQKIDILLISGDIFDTGVPSAQSQKMYYDFLVSLQQSSCQHIIITGGNHDAPGTLNAPKELLNALSIQVMGRAAENIKDEIFELTVNDEAIIIAAVPYLRDQDIRRAVAGESFEELGDRYKTALINHYNDVAEYSKKLQQTQVPIIGMGHLFTISGKTSESEQSIYIGNLGDIGADDFPKIFDYIALGHLHRPQKVGKYAHIRYSGSPIALSFSEINYSKKMVVIETAATTIKTITSVDIPAFRQLSRVSGNVEECIAQLKVIDAAKHDLTPWVDVVLADSVNSSIGYAEIRQAATELELEVLRTTVKTERVITGLDQLLEQTQNIKELAPLEVFKLKCAESEFDLDENPELLDAFNEVLQLAREGL
jgi:exonuclease SbcD